MADIELVIKIPEEKYLYAKSLVNGGKENNPVILAIGNGAPLPKGHERLIDVSDLTPDSDYEDGIFYAVSIRQINDAPTIIEADEEMESKE